MTIFPLLINIWVSVECLFIHAVYFSTALNKLFVRAIYIFWIPEFSVIRVSMISTQWLIFSFLWCLWVKRLFLKFKNGCIFSYLFLYYWAVIDIYYKRYIFDSSPWYKISCLRNLFQFWSDKGIIFSYLLNY